MSLNYLLPRGLLALFGLLAVPFVSSAENNSPGAVYTMNNASDANRVVAFSRNAKGDLKPAGSYPTGGKGLGAGLGNQGALAMTDDGRWLIAVNAGSNELSVFSVRNDSLVLVDVVSSGGVRPISVAVSDNLVYVLNAGGAAGSTDNITGFYLTQHGHLLAVSGSTRPLSAGDVGPAQISFGLRGDVVLVSEKNSNRICGFAIDDEGRAGPAVTNASSGATPFGFAVSSNGHVFVSEAPGSALSSYRLHANGSLSLITASVTNHQAAACWTILSKNEKYAYTANAGNNTISVYEVANDGGIKLSSSAGIPAPADVHPIDMAISNEGRFLYSLNDTSGTIVGFRVDEDGSLSRISAIGGLPNLVTGLIAR
jgi:6-phosphogluconolactonase